MTDHPTEPTDRLLTLNEAAAELGLRPEAVRSRLRRGTLKGHRAGDRWLVALPADFSKNENDPVDHPDRPPVTTDRPPVSGAAEAAAGPVNPVGQVAGRPTATDQLATIMDQWLRPLVDRIEAQATENGRLLERVDQLETRCADLERQLAAAAATPAPPTAAQNGPDVQTVVSTPEAASSPRERPWWRSWWPWRSAEA